MKTMVVVSGGFVSGQPEHAGQLEPGHHHGARTLVPGAGSAGSWPDRHSHVQTAEITGFNCE